MLSNQIKSKIGELKNEYEHLRIGKESLLTLLDEAEVPEAVYNSNAIENSTLTLAETEKILLEMEVSRKISLREVFEAKNLAGAMEYIRNKAQQTELTKDLILSLHSMFIGNIDDKIAGRFRSQKEFVRVGSYIATPPEHVESRVESLLIDYASDLRSYLIDSITKFHLEFELIHPFIDGNGPIGRVIINYQLLRNGLPPITIRSKEKNAYHLGFVAYQDSKNTTKMEKIISLAVIESLHKRLAYLKSQRIIPLVEYSKQLDKPAPVVLNMAARQTLPAFREKGVWKIGI